MSSRHAGQCPMACGPALKRSPMYIIKRYIYRSSTSRAKLTGKPYRWHPTRTCRTRYVEYSKSHDGNSKIFELIINYVLVYEKTRLRILDVGCSSGEASAYLKAKLAKAGLDVIVSGVDPAPEVFGQARRNLDKFYEGYIENVAIDEKHDIVLSARLLRFALPRKQNGLIAECARHCAPGGMLIVDATPVTSDDAYRAVMWDKADQYGKSLIRAWDDLRWWSRLAHTVSSHGGMLFMTALYKAKRAVCSLDWRSVEA